MLDCRKWVKLRLLMSLSRLSTRTSAERWRGSIQPVALLILTELMCAGAEGIICTVGTYSERMKTALCEAQGLPRV